MISITMAFWDMFEKHFFFHSISCGYRGGGDGGKGGRKKERGVSRHTHGQREGHRMRERERERQGSKGREKHKIEGKEAPESRVETLDRGQTPISRGSEG